MNKILTAQIILLLLTGLVSCKKDSSHGAPAALNIINAVIGSDQGITTDFGVNGTTTFIGRTRKVFYGQFSIYDNFFAFSPGTHHLKLWSFPDTTSHDKPLQEVSFTAKEGEMYSLYIIGEKAASELLWVTERYPGYAITDSTFSVNFINLSPGSNPVVVELAGQSQSLGTLAYKASTPYISFPAKSTSTDFVINFKDQATGNIIASKAFEGVGIMNENTWRRKSFTMIMVGSPSVPSGVFAQATMLITR